MKNVKKKKEPKLNKKGKVKVGFLKSVVRTFPAQIKASPGMFVLSSILILVTSVVSSGQIYILERVFNGAAAIAAGNAAVMSVAVWLFVYAGSYILSAGVNQIKCRADVVFEKRAANTLNKERFEKNSRIPPIEFENTDRLDDIEKSGAGLGSAMSALTTFKRVVFYQIPFFVVVSFYLVQREPLLVAALALIFFPSLVHMMISRKLFADREDKAAPVRRVAGHLGECITSPKFFKETRILGAYRFFSKEYREKLKEIRRIDYKTAMKSEFIWLVSITVKTAGNLGVYYLLFRFLMAGRINVGEFAAVYASLGRIEENLSDLFWNSFGTFSEELPAIENYVRFLDIPEDSAPDVELPYEIGIRMRDVSFSYPNATKRAVDGVSLEVKPRETVAIVGENGSGKSTLIKLLCGYYRPDEGEVRIGGYPTTEISFNSIAKRLSAVYQRYPQYALTLRDNLVIGQYEKEVTDDNLTRACAMAGFSPDEEWLPGGLDTMLSRAFDDGVGMSGGQAQRVSIARAFYRDCSVMILDEPTAAIDPLEETRIYERFAKLSRDKTSFIVTHRLGSVRIADRIVMMKDGRIVEIGTHDELMKRGGEYKTMFESQRQWYEDDQGGEPAPAE